jgi:hypothetical protein
LEKQATVAGKERVLLLAYELSEESTCFEIVALSIYQY